MAKEPVEIETKADAWERFERAVDTVVKGGPQHKQKKKPDAVKGNAEKDKESKR
jgi:hypothetical protein